MAKSGPERRELTRDELVEMIRNGERFVLVDVLMHDHFERVHLPGAINLPLPVLRDLAPVILGTHDPVVVYCSNFACTASSTAAKILTMLGFTQVMEYNGGIRDWEDGNLPVVRGEASPPDALAA